MPAGAAISWILCVVSVLLAMKISVWFAILAVLFGIYALVCTCLTVSYTKLIRSLTGNS